MFNYPFHIQSMASKNPSNLRAENQNRVHALVAVVLSLINHLTVIPALQAHVDQVIPINVMLIIPCWSTLST